ncbi:hypothetical protein EXS73_02195 [Candidatus Pacearchaeota archaeon]|nr:hypothetical protein [Candidatus Pacearchaeota archaeon]
MEWDDLPIWLRYGLYGALVWVVVSVFFIPLEFFSSFVRGFFIYPILWLLPNSIQSLILGNFFISTIIGIPLYFLVGSIIGLIERKIAIRNIESTSFINQVDTKNKEDNYNLDSKFIIFYYLFMILFSYIVVAFFSFSPLRFINLSSHANLSFLNPFLALLKITAPYISLFLISSIFFKTLGKKIFIYFIFVVPCIFWAGTTGYPGSDFGMPAVIIYSVILLFGIILNHLLLNFLLTLDDNYKKKILIFSGIILILSFTVVLYYYHQYSLIGLDHCEKIKDQSDRDNCYFMRGQNNLNMTSCDFIQNNAIKSNCQSQVNMLTAEASDYHNYDLALSTNNYSLCLLINMQGKKDRCLTAVALNTSNLALCAQASVYSVGSGYTGGKSDCYYAMAMKMGDISICELMPEDPPRDGPAITPGTKYDCKFKLEKR